MLLNPYTIKRTIHQRGFSILEVLITAAIIGIITAIIVIRYGAFNNTVILNSQAYEMAIDLRETQVFAVSVLGGSTAFREEYGMYFDIHTPNSYRLFLDNGSVVNPAAYDAGEEVGTPYNIDARFVISRICINNCTVDVDDISISFKRPDFDARFSTSNGTPVSSARIWIASTVDPSATRSVEVTSVGQIDVD